jgi:hypothetical protein
MNPNHRFLAQRVGSQKPHIVLLRPAGFRQRLCLVVCEGSGDRSLGRSVF